MPFPDMQNSFYRHREAVDFLRARGIIGGYPDGSFRPTDTINRAELLKLVFLSDDASVSSSRGRRCFSDVNPDMWFAPYVCAAKQKGVVSGYPDGTFKADEPVNAAEAIKIVLKAYDWSIRDAEGERWYEPYTDALDTNDILARWSYIPWEELTRERAADLIWRVLRNKEERFIPRLSPGCGKAAPASPPGTVSVHGQNRIFLLHRPPGYVAHDPVPLVIAFHGRTNSNEQVRSYYKLDRKLSDAIIAYPAALRNGGNSFSWADPGDKAAEIRDIAFFDAIVEQLASDYCIDMDRIFTVGHSLGAWMANSVACVRGGVVRASATVGGDSVITDCAGPSAALISHNPKDNLAPFSGSERVREMRTEENACAWETDDTGPDYLKCVTHRDCDGGNTVLWCPHTHDSGEGTSSYPHTWPRDMADHIATFFGGLR